MATSRRGEWWLFGLALSDRINQVQGLDVPDEFLETFVANGELVKCVQVHLKYLSNGVDTSALENQEQGYGKLQVLHRQRVKLIRNRYGGERKTNRSLRTYVGPRGNWRHNREPSVFPTAGAPGLRCACLCYPCRWRRLV